MPASRSPGAALCTAFELFESGVELMRQKLKRDHPHATGEEIESRLTRWLRERPGAESGDCPGRVVDPRHKST